MIIFWSHQSCCTLEGALVHSTHNTPVRLCYMSFCASSMQCMSFYRPSPFTLPLYPWPCRGGQTASGSSPYKVHAKNKPVGDLRSMGWPVEGLSPAVGVGMSHIPCYPINREQEGSFAGRSPCWTVCVPGLCCAHAACMLLHVDHLVPQKPHLDLAPEAPNAEGPLRKFKTVLWDRVALAVTSCPVALSFSKSLRALYGRAESYLHNSDGETVEQRDNMSCPS